MEVPSCKSMLAFSGSCRHSTRFGAFTGFKVGTTSMRSFRREGSDKLLLKFMATTWSIWKERNQIKFQNQTPSLTRLRYLIRKEIRGVSQVYLGKMNVLEKLQIVVGWKPPDIGTFKIDIGVAVKENSIAG